MSTTMPGYTALLLAVGARPDELDELTGRLGKLTIGRTPSECYDQVLTALTGLRNERGES